MQAAKYGIREFSQMKVLVINAGSSSLKYQLLDTESGEVMAKGLCERIGIDGVLTHTGNKSDEKFKFDIAMPTHKEAIQSVINILLDPEKGVISSMSEIDAVGHRVVHGGEFFSDSVIITEKVLKAIEDCVPLAPLHNPPNLTGIEACREVMGPDVPMVAVFDTAFHQTMPQSHYMYAVPYEYYEKYKIRRYGFHGTSHKYVSQQAAEMLGRPLEELRLITCHLAMVLLSAQSTAARASIPPWALLRWTVCRWAPVPATSTPLSSSSWLSTSTWTHTRSSIS